MSLEQSAPVVQTPVATRLGLARGLDLAERLTVFALFVFFVHRLLPRLNGLVLIERAHPELMWEAADINAQVLLLVIAEALGVALTLVRRYSPTLSQHLLDWALAFGAVILPLLFTTPNPAGTLIPAFITTGLMLFGLLVQISAKFAFWRSFGVVPANRGVKTGGPYRGLRHPMYAGFTLTHIGFLLGFPSLANMLLYTAVLARWRLPYVCRRYSARTKFSVVQYIADEPASSITSWS
jgi:protein-S-isoprenylcysteine O-methyltransferase Ste14